VSGVLGETKGGNDAGGKVENRKSKSILLIWAWLQAGLALAVPLQEQADF